MELLSILNNILFGSAAIVGVYAIGRLFYVAGTAPTNVQQRSSRSRAVVLPTMALDTRSSSTTEPVFTMSWGNGSVTASRVTGFTSKEEQAK
jgi:hypothetical protein